MESKFKLSQYLELAVKFSEDPSDKNLEELNEFINTIQVKEFMPLADKEIVCARILSILNDDFSATGAARFIEMGRIIYGLLGYCVNFENDLDTIALSTPSIYDTIVMNGLYDYILNKCFADYNRLLKMIDNTINANNIGKIIETANMFSPENFNKWEESIKAIKGDLNSKTVGDLIQIAKMGAGSGTTALEKDLNAIAVDQANKELQKEKDLLTKVASDLDKKKKASTAKGKTKEE